MFYLGCIYIYTHINYGIMTIYNIYCHYILYIYVYITVVVISITVIIIVVIGINPIVSISIAIIAVCGPLRRCLINW